jgi:2',3'-cyclic-nucleotide 2'-phosphodiesterase (5'-nucleotidase family)
MTNENTPEMNNGDGSKILSDYIVDAYGNPISDVQVNAYKPGVTLSDDTTKKIAFIGIVTPKTFSNTYLSSIKDSDGNAVYNFLSEGDLLAETVQKYIDQVTSMGADYVILLAHVGMKIDELYTSEGLLSKLTGVTAVLDGHTHFVYNTTSKDKDGKSIHITQTGTKLEHIGELIIRTDEQLQLKT